MYATFNDTQVGTLAFPWFSGSAVLTAGAAGRRATSFPASRSIRYPTPGSPIPEVQLHILDLTNITDTQTFTVQPPKVLDGQ